MPAIVCSCGKQLRIEEAFLGKRVRCPACREVVIVPRKRVQTPTADQDNSQKDPDTNVARQSRHSQKKTSGAGSGFWICLLSGLTGGFVILALAGIVITRKLPHENSGQSDAASLFASTPATEFAAHPDAAALPQPQTKT